MPIEGVSHITFIVRDLEKMALFLCDGLGAEQVYESGEKTFSRSKERFFVLAGTWLAAMEGDPPQKRTYRHLAFKVPDSELDGYAERLRGIGVEFEPPRPRVEGEGRSLYFYDFDNHLFELHSGTLDERLRRYASEF